MAPKAFLRTRSALFALLVLGCTQDFGAFQIGSSAARGGTPSRGDAAADAFAPGNGGTTGDGGATGSGGASGSGAETSSGGASAGGRGASGGSGGQRAVDDAGSDGSTNGGSAGQGSGGTESGGASGRGGTSSGGAGGMSSGGAGGAQGGGGSGGAPPSACKTRYGALPGYLSCGETAQQCRFVQATANAQTCTTICSSRGGSCLRADNGDPGSCTITNQDVGCDVALASSICTCSP